MEPTAIRFGGGVSHTVLHPIVALALVLVAVLTFTLRRKYVIVPWALVVFLVPFGQVVVLGGVHFTVYRIAVLLGLARMATMKAPVEGTRLVGGFNAIDRAFAACAVFAFLSFELQWMETQALVKGIGNLLDALGGYFVVRTQIRDMDDVRRAVKVLAAVAMILAVCMANEHFRHINVFGYLGGVPVNVTMRDGAPRAMGSFEVYITGGVFGATLLPMFVWLASQPKAKLSGILGMVAATVITLTSNSSTPLLAYTGGIVGFVFWPLRKQMRSFRWGVVLLLVSLHLCMKAPVWALIQRVDLTGASSGTHRYMLVDQCIRHFSDWWLIGAKNYDNWGFDMWDLSNQYVACALTGGLATLVAFILVISRTFSALGKARKRFAGNFNREWSVWCICAAVVAHVVAYFGIFYFDQMQAAWYLLLAIVAVVVFETSPARVPDAQEVFVATASAESQTAEYGVQLA